MIELTIALLTLSFGMLADARADESSASAKPAALYNLSTDLAEENNLIDGHPERVAGMVEEFRKTRR